MCLANDDQSFVSVWLDSFNKSGFGMVSNHVNLGRWTYPYIKTGSHVQCPEERIRHDLLPLPPRRLLRVRPRDGAGAGASGRVLQGSGRRGEGGASEQACHGEAYGRWEAYGIGPCGV